jgi:hypothetical protein
MGQHLPMGTETAWMNAQPRLMNLESIAQICSDPILWRSHLASCVYKSCLHIPGSGGESVLVITFTFSYHVSL